MISMKMVGMKAFQQAMKNRLKKLKDRRKVYGRAVVIIDRWIQKNFQQEGKLAMGGGGWKSLAAATIEQRRKGKKSRFGTKILQDRGWLRDKWKKTWTARYGAVQSKMDYSEGHHKGLGHLPERRILPTEKQMMPELTKVFEHFVSVSIK